MYKIIWNASRDVYLETENEQEYLDAIDELAEEAPYDLDVEEFVTVIDDGDYE